MPAPTPHDAFISVVLDNHNSTVLSITTLGNAENRTYRVETPSGPRLLRLSPPGRRRLEEVHSELLWLQALRRDTPLLVPAPLSFPNGDLVRAFPQQGGQHPWLGTVLEWVEGDFRPERLTPIDTRRVGQLAAALHVHAEAFHPPVGFRRPHLRDEPAFLPWDTVLAARPDLTGGQGTVIRWAQQTARAALGAAERGEVRSHLLHGDLHQGNYLFKGEIAGAIDFDDCQFGPGLYDLAATLAHLSLPDHDGTLRAGFLAGYEASRPLWPRERQWLGAFVTMRHLWMLHWILQRDDQPAVAEWAPEYRAWHLGELEKAKVFACSPSMVPRRQDATTLTAVAPE